MLCAVCCVQRAVCRAGVQGGRRADCDGVRAAARGFAGHNCHLLLVCIGSHLGHLELESKGTRVSASVTRTRLSPGRISASVSPGVRPSLPPAQGRMATSAPCPSCAVLCSTVGYRSSKYAASLMDNGQKAVNLQGGILAWVRLSEVASLRAGMSASCEFCGISVEQREACAHI